MSQYSLLEALPVAVFTTDNEGRITFFNKAAAELWGQAPELGTTGWCDSWHLLGPDGLVRAVDDGPGAAALQDGRALQGGRVIAARPDGTRVSFMPYPAPLRDEAGHVVGGINLLVDLTEQSRGEIDLARLASIVACSDDAIVSKTLEGRVTSWNAGATRIFGYTPEEMIGQPIIKIIPPELHGEEVAILAQLRQGLHVDHYESVRVAKDGRRVDVSISISPLRDASGEIVGASKVARDISERKRAERSQQLLIEELNHRVKNTLATVQAIAGLSSRRARRLDEFVASFNGRVQALAKAHTLIAQTRMEGAEIRDLVREQVQLGEADDPRIHCAGPAVTVDAQAAVQLSMVLHELATNARKHGALSVADGSLSLTWELRTAAARELRMLWEEHGVGDVRTPDGSGFGTTLIEQTLRARGGAVVTRYNAGGISSEITLPLPEATNGTTNGRTNAADDGLPAATPHRAGLKGRRILIVEDEPLIAMDIAAGLKSAGCLIVGPAATLDSARRLIAEVDFDAALIDGNLAGEPVDELALALTQKNVPFVFVTGYGRDSLPHGFREALVLGKPFDPKELQAAVETVLRESPEVTKLRRPGTAKG